MLECGARRSDIEPKGSLDAYSSMQYQMIMRRREDAFSVGRILGDHVWPDLGDHRSYRRRRVLGAIVCMSRIMRVSWILMPGNLAVPTGMDRASRCNSGNST